MSFDKAAAGGTSDQLVTVVLNGALGEGESVLAQENGDQGQSIVLTNSRLIVIKLDLAAPGEMDADKTAAYEYASITGVRLRRGPNGAVIQITSDSAPSPAQGQPPMNLVVFSGEENIKLAEIMVDHIAKALGIEVERIGPPTATPPKRTRKVKPALADSVEQGDLAESVERELETSTPQLALDADAAQLSPDVDTPQASQDTEASQPSSGVDTPKPAHEVVRKSLAEEMYEDMMGLADEPTAAPTVSDVTSIYPTADLQVDEVEAVVETEQTSNESDEPLDQPESASEPTPDSVTYNLADLNKLELDVKDAATDTQSKALPSEVANTVETPIEQDAQFNPNPRLPRPVKPGSSKRSRVLLLIGVLALLAIAGVAVVGPMRAPEEPQPVLTRVDKPTADVDGIKADLASAKQLQAAAKSIIAGSDDSAAALKNALGSRNREAIRRIAAADSSEAAISKLESLTVTETLELTRSKLTAVLEGRRAVIVMAEQYVSSGDSALIPIMQSDLLVATGLSREVQADMPARVRDLTSKLATAQATPVK